MLQHGKLAKSQHRHRRRDLQYLQPCNLQWQQIFKLLHRQRVVHAVLPPPPRQTCSAFDT